MRRFQIILMLLVVIPLAAMTFASVSLFNAEVENLQLQKRAAVMRDVDLLGIELRRHGGDIASQAISIVRIAFGRGVWQLRCLYLEPRCDVDPQDLVTFGAVFNIAGTRIYPSQKALEQTFVENRIWARYSPQLNEIVAELRGGKSIGTRRSDGGLGVFSKLVKSVDGPAFCAFSEGLPGADESRAIYCAVLDHQVFQRAVINTQNKGDPKTSQVSALFEISGSDGKVMWASNDNLPRGETLYSGALDWPYDGLKISGSSLPGHRAFLSLPVIGLLAILLPGSFVLVGLAFFLYRQRAVELAIAGKQVERAALISHELRTPLTNIRIYLEMIRGGGPAGPDMEGHCQTIVSEIERLDSLIERTLYSVQKGGPDINLNSRIVPDDIITMICTRFTPLIEAGAAKVALNLNAASLVNVDRWDLEQVLINLIDNARKHALGSCITVSSAIEHGILQIDVVDSEVCTSDTRHTPEKADVLDYGDCVDADGFGLGICREIVQAYGGELIGYGHAHGRHYSASFRIDGNVGTGSFSQ